MRYSTVCCDSLPKFKGNEHAGNNPVDQVEQDLNARGVACVVKDCLHDCPALVVVRVSGTADVPVVQQATQCASIALVHCVTDASTQTLYSVCTVVQHQRSMLHM
jgi:NCAIR mutase (PurE)-related protein